MSPSLALERLNTLSPIFIDAAVRGAVVLLIALALTHLLRRRSAAARHLVWVGAIIVQLALPVFALWGPRWQVIIPRDVSSVLPVDLPTTNELRDGGPTSHGSVEGARSPIIATQSNAERATPSLRTGQPDASTPEDVTRAAPRDTRISGRTLLLVLWIAGAFFVFMRLAIGTSMVARLARKGRRVDDGNWLSLAQKLSTSLQIVRPLTLLRGDKLGVPVTWGIVYPVVLLPDDADSWPEERRRFVLVHEMAHVKRLDALTQLAGQFALALFWFNPLVWIANRRMQLEREHACDDYVLRHGTAPSTYAEELLSMVRSLGTADHRSAQPAFAALAMARRSEFEGRMLSILDPVLDRHPLSKTRTLVSALAALVLVVPLAALHPYQRAEAAAASRATATSTTRPYVRASASVDSGARESRTDAKQPMSSTESDAAQAAAAAIYPDLTPGCDAVHYGSPGGTLATISSGGSIHTHSHDHGERSKSIAYTNIGSAKCSTATIIGNVVYTPAEDDITDMPLGARAVFRERTASDDRVLTFSHRGGGAIVRSYRENDVSAPYDERARRWFTGFLPMVLTEVGDNAAPRVARWQTEGGVDNVLAHISAMQSPSAKRAHYEKLLGKGELPTGDVNKIVVQAARDLNKSSTDLRAVLELAVQTQRGGVRNSTALEAAISSITGSTDLAAVLDAYAQTGDRDMLLAVMRIARTISSSSDKSGLLEELVSRYLGAHDKGLSDAFFFTMKSIPSSGDMRSVLETAIPFAAHSDDIAMQVIETSKAIASSGDRADVLVALVESGAVHTKEMRDAFFSATSTVPSEGDRTRILQAAARH
ncbi:MAG: M56 family metallopeptidase [bacterium]